MQRSPRRLLLTPAAEPSPTWVTSWKTMVTPESLLDLVLDDAYAYLDALERRKGSLAEGPAVSRGAGGSRREGPVRLSLDLAGFAPEDVSVQLEGRKVRVTARRESQRQAPDGCCARDYREVSREVLLPEDADLEGLACGLGADGQLRIEAPRRPPPERVVPIRRVEAQNGEQGQPMQNDEGGAGGAESEPAGKK